MQYVWYKRALIIVKFVMYPLRIIGTYSNELKHCNSHSVIDSVYSNTLAMAIGPAVTASVLSYQV